MYSFFSLPALLLRGEPHVEQDSTDFTTPIDILQGQQEVLRDRLDRPFAARV